MSFNKFSVQQPYNGGSRLKAQFRKSDGKDTKTQSESETKVDAEESFGPCPVCAETDDPRDITYKGEDGKVSDKCKRCFAVALKAERAEKQAKRQYWLENKEEFEHECYSGLDCKETAVDQPDFPVLFCGVCYNKTVARGGDLRQCAGGLDGTVCTLLGPHKYCAPHGKEHGLVECSTEGCGNLTFGEWCSKCTNAYKEEQIQVRHEEYKARKAERENRSSDRDNGRRSNKKKAAVVEAAPEPDYVCKYCNYKVKGGSECKRCVQ